MDSRERKMRAAMKAALEETLRGLVEDIESLTQRRREIEQALAKLAEPSVDQSG